VQRGNQLCAAQGQEVRGAVVLGMGAEESVNCYDADLGSLRENAGTGKIAVSAL
jgi:hypothetical protein